MFVPLAMQVLVHSHRIVPIPVDVPSIRPLMIYISSRFFTQDLGWPRFFCPGEFKLPNGNAAFDFCCWFDVHNGFKTRELGHYLHFCSAKYKA